MRERVVAEVEPCVDPLLKQRDPPRLDAPPGWSFCSLTKPIAGTFARCSAASRSRVVRSARSMSWPSTETVGRSSIVIAMSFPVARLPDRCCRGCASDASCASSSLRPRGASVRVAPAPSHPSIDRSALRRTSAPRDRCRRPRDGTGPCHIGGATVRSHAAAHPSPTGTSRPPTSCAASRYPSVTAGWNEPRTRRPYAVEHDFGSSRADLAAEPRGVLAQYHLRLRERRWALLEDDVRPPAAADGPEGAFAAIFQWSWRLKLV
jgi:hypothetical protein